MRYKGTLNICKNQTHIRDNYKEPTDGIKSDAQAKNFEAETEDSSDSESEKMRVEDN